MFKNYFYLARCIGELNNSIVNKSIAEAFSQERDKLYLRISDHEFPNRHLIISANAQLSYLSIKNEHFKAKRNTVNFFDDLLPRRIVKLEIAAGDRIIKVTLDSGYLIFRIKGASTNVFLITDKDEVLSFKKIKNDDDVPEEVKNTTFISSPSGYEYGLKSLKDSSKKSITDKFPFIGKEIFFEA